MAIRITTNAILRNYKSNLAASMTTLDKFRTQVMTGRKFSSVSEDPASALRAAVLERKYARNEDYINLVDNAQSFQNAQEDAAMQINNIAITLSKDYGLEALNSTNQSLDVRTAYADAWEGAMESIIMSMNSTYEGKFVFAGSDGADTAPFELVDGTLFYRGVDVDSTGQADLDALELLSGDTAYLDLGFGLEIENGVIESTSAFNTSFPGINVIGYGQDEDGNSQNMVVLAGQIAEELRKEDFDYERYQELLTAFDETRSTVLSNITEMGTRTEFLTATKERLETAKISLAEQYDNVVNVDMAEAITEYSWAQYAYNASLKVGTSILSPSFIDFMS